MKDAREIKGSVTGIGAGVGASEGLRKFMISVFNRMFAALALTGVVAYVCTANTAVLELLCRAGHLLWMVPLGFAVYMSARINRVSAREANSMFWVYSAILGVSFAPICIIYTGASIANAFLSAAVFFGSMSLYGYTTKRDLTGVGSFMVVGLWSVIAVSLANVFFLKSALLDLGLAALSVMIFCGLTAYDIQKISGFYGKSLDEETLKKGCVIGSLILYLDFINLFMSLLRLVGRRR